MRDLATYLLLLLTFVVLAAGLRRLATWLRVRGASARTVRWVNALSQAAAFIVQRLEHTVVAALKDPQQPGAWDDAAKHSVKEAAVQELRAAVARELEEMRGGGVAPERIDTLVDASIETAVRSLKNSGNNTSV